MIDVEDLAQFLQDQGYITKWKSGTENIQITCPKPHEHYDPDSGEVYLRKERRPSMGIRREPPYMFNCFACGFKGTIEFLVSYCLGIDPVAASVWLDERYNYDPGHYRKLEEAEVVEYGWGTHSEDRTFAESAFRPYKILHPYTLTTRGLSRDIAIKYEIGYDKENNRVVTPIRNDQGELVGMVGRALSPEEAAKEKYHIYWDCDRGRYLYRSKPARRKGSVLVVETGFDVAWCDQCGIVDKIDVVALLGSKPTPTQCNALCEYSEVISGLDSDAPGREGTEILAKKLGRRTRVKAVQYPPGKKDAGECTKDELFEALAAREFCLFKDRPDLIMNS